VSVADVSAALRAVIDGIERERQRAARVAAALQSQPRPPCRDGTGESPCGPWARALRRPTVFGRPTTSRPRQRMWPGGTPARWASPSPRPLSLPPTSVRQADRRRHQRRPPGLHSRDGSTMPEASCRAAPVARAPTHGLLFDGDGTPLTGTPLTQSGGLLRSGAAPGARDGLRPDWHPLAQVTREHVEAHAAALLRGRLSTGSTAANPTAAATATPSTRTWIQPPRRSPSTSTETGARCHPTAPASARIAPASSSAPAGSRRSTGLPAASDVPGPDVEGAAVSCGEVGVGGRPPSAGCSAARPIVTPMLRSCMAGA
jgi:hypothetical protein